jgi:hypothetical protein
MRIERLTNYEDEYIIDELGNVVTIPSENKMSRNQYDCYYLVKGKIDNRGYVRVTLTKEGKSKEFLLHRLVAQQFIPNPDNLPQVNHINGIKADNRAANLEWVSAKENKQHAYQNDLSGTRSKCIAVLDRINATKKYIKIVLEKDGESFEFSNSNEAAAFAGCHKDKITHAIKHGVKARGYCCYGEKAQPANEET